MSNLLSDCDWNVSKPRMHDALSKVTWRVIEENFD